MANSAITVQYGGMRGDWTTEAQDGANILITDTDNFHSVSPGIDKVEVVIKKTLSVDGKLFARLNVAVTQP